MRCDQCKFWNNERSKDRFRPTWNDDGPYPRDNRVGYCLAASNYAWGKRPKDRPWNGEPPMMMPTDWAGFQGMMYTRDSHGCTSYQQKPWATVGEGLEQNKADGDEH